MNFGLKATSLKVPQYAPIKHKNKSLFCLFNYLVNREWQLFCGKVLMAISASILTGLTFAASTKETIKVGLVDTFPPSFYMDTFSPTADYLIESLPQYHFEFVEIDPNKIISEIDKLKPAFLISSSFTYVNLLESHGAHQVVTKEDHKNPNLINSCASTIVVPANSPINKISDAKNKVVVINDKKSFEGWLIAKGQILKEGFNPDTFFSGIKETHYGIPGVLSLLKLGHADVGVLESCSLEELIKSGQVKPNDFRVLNAHKDYQGCVVSTESYPDAVFSSLPGVSPEITKEVAVALLTMPTKHLSFQWTIVNDFVPTYELMKSLKVGPFRRDDGSFYSFWTKYKSEGYLVIFLVFLLFAHIIQINFLVRKRTAQLSKALQETKKFYLEAQANRQKLDSLERMSIVSQISSMFAHEIKQPITNIGYYAGALGLLLPKEGSLGKKSAEIIKLLNNELHKSAQIVEHVRGLAKKRPRLKKIFDIGQVVESAVTSFDKSQILRNEVVKGKYFTQGDPFEIEFVILNFIKNSLGAVKDVKKPRIKISISEQDVFWKIDVTDNGPEISEELFEQLGTSVQSSKMDGLGFGLSICRAIAESHGGHLDFKKNKKSGLIASLYVERSSEKPGGSNE